MCRKVKLLLIVPAVFACASTLCGDTPEPTRTSALMRRKLEQAQKVLEGIALNDFDKIAKSADALLEISKAVEFRIVQTPQYQVRSNEFRRIVEDLGEQARQKNLDGAALSYLDLTLSCVKCHNYFRGKKRD